MFNENKLKQIIALSQECNKCAMLHLKAFVNQNKRLPHSTKNRNLYERMKKFVVKINTANDTKKTREQIVEEYLSIKLSNVSNI